MHLLFRLLVILALVFSTHASAFDAPWVVPVKIETRTSIMDHHTSVARIENLTDSDLTVTIVMERTKGDARKTFNLTIAKHHFKEIGKTQGWKVFPGDKITVSSDGYAPLTQQL